MSVNLTGNEPIIKNSGVYHNQILDKILNFLESHPRQVKLELSRRAKTIKYIDYHKIPLIEFYESVTNERASQFIGGCIQGIGDIIFGGVNRNADNKLPLSKLDLRFFLNEFQNAQLNKIKRELQSGNNLLVIERNLDNLKRIILNNANSNSEAVPLLLGIEVGKSSYKYWIENTNKWRNALKTIARAQRLNIPNLNPTPPNAGNVFVIGQPQVQSDEVGCVSSWDAIGSTVGGAIGCGLGGIPTGGIGCLPGSAGGAVSGSVTASFVSSVGCLIFDCPC